MTSHLQVSGISKTYGAARALTEANLAAERGQIHGICGANGAGKSTLIRILAGATRPDAGQVALGGEVFRQFTPEHSTALGIGVVYQELALIPELPVYKNIFLGIEARRAQLPRTAAMRRRAKEILAQMGVDLDVNMRVGDLGLHQQQIVEIAKALCRGSSLLILDEPTAILNTEERRKLFTVLRELKQKGLCILFITHFINELFEVCDRLTVMRDGRTVGTFEVSATDPDSVVFAMVGAVARHQSVTLARDHRKPVLAISGGAIARKFSDLSLDVGEGEMVGLAGLVGSGCYEVAEALFGLRRLDQGEMRVAEQIVRFAGPRDAVRAGIGYVPEDRRTKGLCLDLASSTNTALPSLAEQRFSIRGFVKAKAVRKEFLRVAEMLRLHPQDPALPAGNFSGGNQQKLVLGKWIEKGCRAYVLVEPTRGVDVGAKVEIWKIIEQLGKSGAAVVVVSTDFDDIAAVCSRCLVFASGRVTGEFVRPDINVENLSAAALAAPKDQPGARDGLTLGNLRRSP